MHKPEGGIDTSILPHGAAVNSAGRPVVLNYAGGRWLESTATEFVTVMDPSSGVPIARTPLSTGADVDHAVQAAAASLREWEAAPVKERAQVFFRYKRLLEKNLPDLAALIVKENGKTHAEGAAEMEKSVEVTEFACAMPQIVSGEILEVSRGVECRSERRPVGVVACVTPFNFPSMVPHWTIPNALVLGNAMVLKPSPLVPLSSLWIAELLREAGLPDGVFNVVHGGQEAVEALCDHPGVRALTFVGSTRVARTVYGRACMQGKQALCLGGAKNHLILLPDADPEMAASNIAASMTACAGQRCMAASVLLAVGDVDSILERLCIEAARYVPGHSLGAVISRAAKERIEEWVTDAEREGAEVLLDGRGAEVAGRESGFFVGPTILDRVRPEMRIAREEVFGPVLAVVRVATLQEAVALENRNPYGNAASVFTSDGGAARYVAGHAGAGMIGVNVGVPVPREPFSFGGWNDSKFGAGDITGRSSIEFFTRPRKITVKWDPEARRNWMS